jgi:aspartate ammonia-lyase
MGRVTAFYSTLVGKKVVMAASGVILFLYIVGHLLGNLQIFEGPERLNAYAHFLKSTGEILWAVRIVLLAAVVLHIIASVQVTLASWRARPAGYAEKCTGHLARITGFPIHLAEDLIEATQDTQAFVLYSSCMKSLAIKLSKVCNDLRLLSSGPRCGLGEINLPPKQPGSSIMPGKVNPVIPEVVNMVCFRVIGSDLTVSMAAEGGQLQLNVFEPVIAACVFEAQTMFINAARTLRVHCVEGITANPDVCRHYVDYSIGTVTALNPVIGYDRSTELAAEAMKSGRGILEIIRERKLLTEEQIATVLDPAAMTGR